jgi:anion-transporting  ArsA/GET3 family ATPase
MDTGGFLTRSRVLIVAGKGGVGKTTVAAAVARAAARAGLSALIVEIEGKSGLTAAFGHPDQLVYDEAVVHPGAGGEPEIRARTLTPDAALLEYLEDHGLKRVSKRLVQSGALDVVATAVPGIKDILVLGKIKQIERSGRFDVVIVDAPAAGHAVTFLTSAAGLVDAVRVGPIRTQAQDVLDMLRDPERCQVLLVTLPEETPVNEVVDTAFLLEDRVGVALGGVVVNGLYPPIDGLDDAASLLDAEEGLSAADGEGAELLAAAEFRRHRQQLQTEQVARLEGALPLDRFDLPFLFTTEVGPAEIDRLAGAFSAAVEVLR